MAGIATWEICGPNILVSPINSFAFCIIDLSPLVFRIKMLSLELTFGSSFEILTQRWKDKSTVGRKPRAKLIVLKGISRVNRFDDPQMISGVSCKSKALLV